VGPQPFGVWIPTLQRPGTGSWQNSSVASMKRLATAAASLEFPGPVGDSHTRPRFGWSWRRTQPGGPAMPAATRRSPAPRPEPWSMPMEAGFRVEAATSVPTGTWAPRAENQENSPDTSARRESWTSGSMFNHEPGWPATSRSASIRSAGSSAATRKFSLSKLATTLTLPASRMATRRPDATPRAGTLARWPTREVTDRCGSPHW